jgi:hypothetical protein
MPDSEPIGDAIGNAVARAITDAYGDYVIAHTHRKSYVRTDINTCPDCLPDLDAYIAAIWDCDR